MTKKEKNQVIDGLAEKLRDNSIIYLADVSNLNAEATSKLRRMCFSRNISMHVVKNTLLGKALEKVEDKNFGDLSTVLVGNTSMMLAETANAPAKLIKEFRKKSEKPVLKAAYVEESVYIGDEMLDALVSLKSKEELIGDIIMLLQSPVKTVISQLQSGGSTLSGIVKTLSER